MKPQRLRTERLVLEPVGVERARRICAGDLSGLEPAPGWPHADTVDALGMSAQAADDADTAWLILRAGRVVGDIGAFGPVSDLESPATPPREVEIGYGLAAPERGKGYATEAARELVRFLLTLPGTSAVVAEVDAGNLASEAVLAHLGFTRVTPAGSESADGASRSHWRLARPGT